MHHCARAQRLVENIAHMAKTFLLLEDRCQRLLEGIDPADVEPTPPKMTIPMLPPPPVEHDASSFQDFDPRSVMRDAPTPSDGKIVSIVGDRAGLRVSSGRVQEGLARDAKLVQR